MALSEQELIRREKLGKLRALGINPYPAAEFKDLAGRLEVRAGLAAKQRKKKLKPISQQSKRKCTQHKRKANYPDRDTEWGKVFKRIKSDNSNFKIKRVRKLNKAIEHIHNKYNIQCDGNLDKLKGASYVIYGKRDRCM